MKSNKCLCIGMLMFNLPDDFTGKRQDALRLLADYLDETDPLYEGKESKLPNISGKESYNKLTEMVTNSLLDNQNIKLKMIGMHIADTENW